MMCYVKATKSKTTNYYQKTRFYLENNNNNLGYYND